MTTLAAADGQFIFYIIFAIIGVVNWLMKQSKENVPTRKRDASTPMRRETEEERMKRFLEALGVPADQRPPPKVQPRPAPSQPPQLPKIEPRGSVVSTWPPKLATQKKRKAPAPPPIPERPARPEPLPELTTASERVRNPDLITPEVRDFETAASRVSAIPGEKLARLDEPEAAREEHALATLLRSRNQLRNAILLREILGPPRGLASDI